MLILQIKQAEIAIAHGRLDEACELLQNTRLLREHRRGQSLATELVGKLHARAEAHLESDRYEQALKDCDKAQLLAGNQAPLADLRARIEQSLRDAHRQRSDDARVGTLQNAVQLVDSAVRRKDLDRAVHALARARAAGCDDHPLRELDARVRADLVAQIVLGINAGRLDEAESLLERLDRLDPAGLATQQHRRTLDQASRAKALLDDGCTQDAREILARLAIRIPEASWVRAALEQVTIADQHLASVRSGPLGTLTMSESKPRIPGEDAQRDRDPAPPAHVAHPLPARFILQVDGAESCLVFCKPSVTLGPISSSRAPDVGLMADPSASVVQIERNDDDYFLRGAGAEAKLLSAGERISISPRCTLMFGLPNASSTSAVLDLTAGRLPRADVRRIILLDRDLVIGPGNTSHVRAPQLSEPIVLHVRNGCLWYRQQALAMGVAAALPGVSLTLAMG